MSTKKNQVEIVSISNSIGHSKEIINLIISEGFTCGENLPILGLVALFDNQVIGYIGYSITYKDNAFVHMLVVNQAARNKGIGKKLINEAMKHLISTGVKRIEATVDFESKEAIGMYSNLGAKMRPVMLVEAFTDEIESRTR